MVYDHNCKQGVFMNLKNGLYILTSLSLLTACQNGGNSPSPASSTEKDYYAIAMALAPSITYTIPTDLETDCYFNSEVVTSGSSIVAYASSSVAFGESCLSESRTCENGILSGSYNYASCSVNAAASCLFNGATIADGQSITAYINSSAPVGESCQSEVRTCTNGILSGSASYAGCQVDGNASCLFDGKTILHGESTSAFLNSSESFGSTCQLEFRTCENGVLSGSNQYSTCLINEPASCLFNGQTIAHGENVNAFLNSNVEFGSSCQTEVRSCNNGVLSGTNEYASCSVGESASCLFNGQTMAHGEIITAFEKSNVEYGQACTAETRVCDNGHLSGTFSYASCDAGQAASCLFNGQTIPDGASINAFASSTASASEGCSNENRVCSNGVLSGSFEYGMCEIEQPKACLFNGKTINSGDSIVAYQHVKSDNKGKCQSEVRECNDGVLSGTYENTSCKLKDYPNHHDDEDWVKICKNVREIKHKYQHDEKGLYSKWENSGKQRLKERFNCGKHLGWYKHNNRNEHPTCQSQNGWYQDKKHNH